MSQHTYEQRVRAYETEGKGMTTNHHDALLEALREALGTLLRFTDATHATVQLIERAIAKATSHGEDA